MILSTRTTVRIADLYFNETPPAGLRADIVRHNQSPVRIEGAVSTPFSTIVVDLSDSEDRILGNLKSHTRWKIRRAQKDGLSYEFSNDGNPAAVERFADHLDRCTDLKQLPRASRKRMAILAAKKAFDVSFVRDSSGDILAASSYLVTPERVRGLWAGAAYRSTTDQTRRTLIGRANRMLYWRDMLRFKEAGIQIFDFGGYYNGSDDAEKLRVNGFKLEFGGQVWHEFNCEMGITIKGKLALWALRQRGQFDQRRRARVLQPVVEEHESSLPSSV
jgi:lipid II:glycine glycyltransferase (peptidoglycan interpeptide bridge formation enzyme)